MHAPFLLNNTALFFNGTVVKVEFAGKVSQHQQHSIQQLNAVGGHIGDLETGIVKSCRSIDVFAVRDTVVLQDVHHVDVWEIAGALECDVFDEVSEAALILFLDQ